MNPQNEYEYGLLNLAHFYRSVFPQLMEDLKRNEINFDRIDTETKALEEREALNEDKWDEHKEQCAGCAACTPEL